MGSFHFLYNFSVFKSLGFFLFTSFMFKCTSHFRPHCFRHISWCLFLWAFWLNCLLGSSLTRQKPLNVMGIASWMNSSHQRARCIEMEDGSSPAIPGHLQHSFLLCCFGGVHSAAAAERCHGHSCDQMLLKLLLQSDIVAAKSPALLRQANLIFPTSSWFWVTSWNP